LTPICAIFEFPLVSKLDGGAQNVLPWVSSTLSLCLIYHKAWPRSWCQHKRNYDYLHEVAVVPTVPSDGSQPKAEVEFLILEGDCLFAVPALVTAQSKHSHVESLLCPLKVTVSPSKVAYLIGVDIARSWPKKQMDVSKLERFKCREPTGDMRPVSITDPV